MPVKIDPELCTGCGTCVDICPMGCLKLTEKEGRKVAEFTDESCTSCYACVQSCPNNAIKEVE